MQDFSGTYSVDFAHPPSHIRLQTGRRMERGAAKRGVHTVKRYLVAAALLMAVIGATAQLAAAPKLGTGTREIGASGSLSDTDGGMSLDLDLTGGYFIMPYLEVGGRFSWHYDSPADDTMADFAIGVFGEYSFIVPRLLVVPYAGASLSPGYWSGGSGKADDSGYFLELRVWGGAKYYIVEALSVGCQLELSAATDEIYNRAGRGGDSADWRLVLRTSYYF